MRFIHLADVHLGAEPESGTPLGELRKQEIWDAFADIIEKCEKEQTELLLIAGDLFHGQPLLREVKEVDYLFRKLTKTKVVMIAGNHDCLLPASHYYDVTFPEHVTFLMDTQADSVFIPELNTQVFGLSYEKKQIPEPRYDGIQIEDASRINILLAHGNINGGDKSIPLHRAAIEAAGFDYAALGHIHTHQYITGRIAYTGSFEPLERKETGRKGYIEGTLEKTGAGQAEVYTRFVPHAKREYVRLNVPVTPEMTELAVADSIRKRQEELGRQHMYQVVLTGRRARELTFSPEAFFQSGFVVEVQDETVPDFDIPALKEQNADNLIGRFIREIAETEETSVQGQVLKERALQYGLQALLARDGK
ncbi:MAG: exonuclease SbcCD subunit D [Lachnospiraceae bacterium]